MRHCRRVPHTTGNGNIRPHEVPYIRRTTELHRSGPHVGPIEVSVIFTVGTPFGYRVLHHSLLKRIMVSLSIQSYEGRLEQRFVQLSYEDLLRTITVTRMKESQIPAAGVNDFSGL
jgi:hypothetical protein